MAFNDTAAQNQVYYVCSNGSDTNSGLNVDNALASFGQAITLATALTPSISNQFSINCVDAGVYTENITLPSYVDVVANNATINGTIILNDFSNIRLGTLNVADGFIGITKNPGTEYSRSYVRTVNVLGTGAGFASTGGPLIAEWSNMTVIDGFGVVDITGTGSEVHVRGHDLYIYGTGTGLGRTNGGEIVGFIDHIDDQGSGNGTAIYMLNGTIDLTVNKIACGIAVNIDGTAGTCVLNLICNDLSGTQTVTNGAILNLIQPVAPGGIGQVLTSNGPGIPPNYQTPGGSSPSSLGFYGDGSDGPVTFDGISVVLSLTPVVNVYTLARDIFLSDTTINPGVTIITNGFRLFCSGTLTNNGTIQWNGNNGSNVGGVAGAQLINANSSIQSSVLGAAGGAGATGIGANGALTSGASMSGSGGNAGSGTSAGGLGEIKTKPLVSATPPRALPMAMMGATLNKATYGASGNSGGGGGGGGDGVAFGGGGASGGGVVIVLSYLFAGTGIISANGGIGGNGQTGATKAGGGGGGGGGAVYVTSRSVSSGAIVGQTITANGGAGGAGTGTGNSGSSGTNGTVILLCN